MQVLAYEMWTEASFIAQLSLNNHRTGTIISDFHLGLSFNVSNLTEGLYTFLYQSFDSVKPIKNSFF